MSVLKDNSGAVAIEYVLIMVFAAVFIIAGLRTVIPVLNVPFSAVAVCLADLPNCASVVSAWIDGEAVVTVADDGGDFGGNNRSGLGDGTNPGAGSAAANSPNEGVFNPGGLLSVGDAADAARDAARDAAEGLPDAERDAARDAADAARDAARDAADAARDAARQRGG